MRDTPTAAGLPASNRLPRRVAALLAGAVIVFAGRFVLFVAHASHEPTTFDDAYMFIRYARNWLGGYGLAWNPSEDPVYGTTSLLHCFVVTILRAGAPLSDAHVLLLASALPVIAAWLLASYSLSRLAITSALRHNWLAWLALLAPLLLVNETVLYHAQSGMDTMLSLLCNVLLVHCTLVAVGRPGLSVLRPVILAAYLAFLARPENGILAVLFAGLALVLLSPPPGAKRRGALYLAALAGILAMDALLKQLVFADVVPLSYYVKRSGFYQGYLDRGLWNPFKYLELMWKLVLPCAAVFVLVLARRHARIGTVFAVPVVAAIAYYFTVVQVMGAQARFYVPLLPLVISPAALLLDRAMARVDTPTLIPTAALVARVALLGLAATTVPLGLRAAGRQYDRQVRQEWENAAHVRPTRSQNGLPRLGWWSSIQAMSQWVDRAPAGTTVALSEVGLVGARAPHVRLIDLSGLNDRVFAHQGFSAEDLFRRQPDVIWLPPAAYSQIVNAIELSPRLREEYLYYPGAFDYGLALRRESPRMPQILPLVHAAWRTCYGTALGELPAPDSDRYTADREGLAP
jgi:hypothetical protein